MEYQFVFSPTHGFWSDQGWTDDPRLAMKITSGSPVVMNFITDDVLLIRKKDVQFVHPYPFLDMIIKLATRRWASGSRSSYYMNVLHRMSQRYITKEGSAFLLSDPNETFKTLDDLRTSLVKSLWAQKPGISTLRRWGTLIMECPVFLSDDGLYVININSPVSCENVRTKR